MELRPPLRLGVVAIEKGAFRLPLTKSAKFTYLYHSQGYLSDRELNWVTVI